VNATTRAAMNDAVIRRETSWRRERNMAVFILFMLAVIVGAALVFERMMEAGWGAAPVVRHAAPPKAVPRAAAPVAATPTVDIVKLQAPCPTKAHVEGTTVVWFCDDGSVFYTRLGR
jgi:hypothetical protein